jgi:hypothetical protein
MIDGDLLEEFIPVPHYKKLTQYADDNNLKFKKKNEFLKILDYYDSLIGKWSEPDTNIPGFRKEP